jgi:hypothetical protein
MSKSKETVVEFGCKNCLFLQAPKFPPPGGAIGTCQMLSQRYGGDMAWAEVGNQFVPLYVGANFGCKHFVSRYPTL